MPTRPQALLASIRDATDAFAVVKAFADNKVPEDEYLEFKSGGKINPKDIGRYWSQAASGFANSGGGVLVFGIETGKEQPPDGGMAIDTAIALDLVPRPREVAELLKQKKLEVTIDLIQGIEIFPIEGANGNGFVVCFVPEGNQKPYRAALDPSKNYFQRVGDSFVILSHSLLRSLFYPKLVAKLRILARVTEPDNDFNFVLSIKNYGPATASQMSWDVRPSRAVKIARWSGGFSVLPDAPGAAAERIRVEAHKSIHPGETLEVFSFKFSSNRALEIGFKVRVIVYVLDQQPLYFHHELSLADYAFGGQVSPIEFEQAESFGFLP